MKKGTAILVSVLLVLSVTAWASGQQDSSSSGKTVVIKVKNFGSDKDAEAYHAAYLKYQEAHPNVQITDTFVPIGTWREYTAKTLAEAAAGQAPDILALASESIRQIHSVDLLASLDDYIKNDKDASAMLDDISPTLRNGFVLGGKVWAIPSFWNGIYAYYNTDLWKQAGLATPTKDFTWDDLRAAAKKITKRDSSGNTTVWGFAPDMWLNGLSSWVYSNGSDLLTNDMTKSNLKDPKVAEAFQFIADLINVDKTMPRPDADANANGQSWTNLFANGKLGIIYGGHQYTQVFMANNFSNYDVIRIATNGSHTSSYGCAAFSITKSSKNKQVAWDIIKALVSVPVQTLQSSQGTSIPSRRSVCAGAAFLKWPKNAGLFYGLLDEPDGFKPVTAPVNYTEFEAIMYRYVNQVFAGSMSASEAMVKADAEIVQALARSQGN
jgi:multiple sugar transport system substrate-binding protein